MRGFLVIAALICLGGNALSKPLLCPAKNEELSKIATQKYDWKPVYDGYLVAVTLTSMALTSGGRTSKVVCIRERGEMAVKAGTCKMIFGEGKFVRRDLIVGVSEGCELDVEHTKSRAYEGRDTNDDQCRIECDD